MSGAPAPVVILISGRGSNLQAILTQACTRQLPIEVRAVISNNPDAEGLKTARAAGVHTEVIDHRALSDRTQFDTALMQAIDYLQCQARLSSFTNKMYEDVRAFCGPILEDVPRYKEQKMMKEYLLKLGSTKIF